MHADQARARELGRRYAELGPLVAAIREQEAVQADLEAAREMAAEDKDMAEMAEQLRGAARRARGAHPRPARPARPGRRQGLPPRGQGGGGRRRGALFAGDLVRMYTRYAEQRGWKIEVISATEGELGGYKDIQLAVKSRDPANPVFGRLKYEGGVHRVQRVPVTESQGRIHTSAAGVLVLPEAEEVDVTIDQNDLRIDVYRSSGPGGQSVNTTDSAVRITHLPTGVTVAMQNEKSQLQNKEAGMRVLRARLLALALEEQAAKDSAVRGAQIRTVDRSEKVRTYNFPDNRVADHRSGYKANNLSQVLDGDLDAGHPVPGRRRHRRQARWRGRMTPLRTADRRRHRPAWRPPASTARSTTPARSPCTCSGWPSRRDLLLVDDLDDDQAAAYDDLVARRAERVPLQHLTGSVGFRYIELEVGPGVFVPRPETESVVQWAVDALRGRRARRCASTCAPAAARSPSPWPTSCPAPPSTPSSATPTRSTWTRRNAANRVAAGDPEVHLHLGSAEDALPGFDGTLDLVISNPPYVATTEAHIPDPEVVDHDPGIALWAGEDGLDVIRLVEQAARRLLKPGGLLVVEHSDRQGTTAPALLEQAGGWTEVADHRDSPAATATSPPAGPGARHDRRRRGARTASDGVRQAVAALRRGELAVLPTDTVYGIAADAFSPPAVDRLLAAKGRGRDMPVPGPRRLLARPRRPVPSTSRRRCAAWSRPSGRAR